MIKLATVFSGIGAIEFALRRLSYNYEIEFACDNGDISIEYDKEKEMERILSFDNYADKKEYVDKLYRVKSKKTNYVKETYLANYKDKLVDNNFFQDIRLLDGNDFTGKVDLLVGGSPCQTFSEVGKQEGLRDPRGLLINEFVRIVDEVKPKVFIYENVKNLLTHNKCETWKIVEKKFKSTNYRINKAVLNSLDFDIPQKRNRLFVIGTQKPYSFNFMKFKKAYSVQTERTMQQFLIDNCVEGQFTYGKGGEIIVGKQRGKLPREAILTPAVQRYVKKGGTKNFYQKPETDLPLARTLLKTMFNHHRAGIDNYITVDKENGTLRGLTPREALRLMGFTDDFIITAKRNNTLMEAGNSIVVDVLIALVKELVNMNLLDPKKE